MLGGPGPLNLWRATPQRNFGISYANVLTRAQPAPQKNESVCNGFVGGLDARLNFPKVPPDSFNAEQLAFNVRMAKDLCPPPDMSPRQSYTRDITHKEIEEMKRHIKAHGLDTAFGVDGFSYEDCWAIPNQKLLEFFLYCLKNQDMPQFWLTSLLI
ncbi:hypothetical protein DFH06DRAFT_1346189 [Mycena polygramma]|nr:hypothetical protein DFH06DRAFT_1346189 [Mycena polygramma]